MMMETFSCVVFLLITGYVIAGESSTNSPVNRGAARQMYGSASLRHTGSAPPIISTTEIPHHRNDLIENRDSKYHFGDHKSNDKFPDQHESDDFFEQPDINPLDLPESDYDSEVPSYRNGIPVGTGYHNPGRSGNLGKGIFDWPRPGVYGGYDIGDHRKLADRLRVYHGLSRGHGINPYGNADFQNRFGDDEKELIHETEGETENNNNVHSWCHEKCSVDQFMCISSCHCIGMNRRCDGTMNCENGEDEMECDEIFETRRTNQTCQGEINIVCPLGMCISKLWLCDGDNDCVDYSDESHCGNERNCTADQFECKDKLCIPKLWRCDGERDCPDYSDEENCTGQRECKSYEHTCPYPGGPCILKRYLCDGEDDCGDGSDELACHIHEISCEYDQFKCKNSRCIAKGFRCDGTDDCLDGSDEEDCYCSSNELKCLDDKCVNHSAICNGRWDCEFGEDEVGCNTITPAKNVTCNPKEFLCPTGECIPDSWICDAVPDCPNAADEEECPDMCHPTEYLCKAPPNHNNSSVQSHSSTMFYMHSYCISKKRLCDSFADCPLKDDEQDCPTKRNCTSTDKCTQHCILTKDKQPGCACDMGFTLAPDNYTCQDINECEFRREHVCSQLCNNTIGSFMCGCMTGYVLRPDLRTCKAIGSNPSLIFTDRINIQQVSLEPYSGIKYNPIIKNLHNAVGLNFDHEKGFVYWSDVSQNSLWQVPFNGGNSKKEGYIDFNVGSIAYDWVHNLFFIVTETSSTIRVFSASNPKNSILMNTQSHHIRDITVHPKWAYIFWTEYGKVGCIRRSEMDGSDEKVVVGDDIVWPNGVTIDYAADMLYWTEAKHRVIMSSTLDGLSKKKIISRGLHHPFGITVFEDSIYWTDWHLKSIYSAHKETGKNFRIVQSTLHFPMRIHVYHKQRQPPYPNHCGNNNGRCAHLCLPKKNGHKCACYDGYVLSRDKQACNRAEFLILARKHELRMLSTERTDAKKINTIIPVENVKSAVALDWDGDDEMIYWTDVELDTISRAHLTGADQEVVINNNLESPAGLALDWVTRKIYWTDTGTSRIECSNLAGTMRALLIYEGLDKPRDIIVEPTESGYMYWSDWGENPKIERAGMDGSNRIVLISDNLMWPNGLSIDHKHHRLYWTDGGMKSIESVDVKSPSTRRRMFTDLPHPFGLVMNFPRMWWTDWETKSVHGSDLYGNPFVLYSNLSGIMDVRYFHQERVKPKYNPCEKNGGCSHICLIAPQARDNDRLQHSCTCPVGLMLEPHSNSTCQKIPNSFIIFAHRIDIRFISFDTPYRVDAVLPFKSLIIATGVDVDRKTGDIFWSDPGRDVITRGSFDGKRNENIINSGIDTADSVVIDSIGRKIYWTDAGLNSIEVAELDGSNRKILVWTGLDNPRAIALHYSKGLMFWSDWGQNARIERANMDGEERMTVITEDLVWPNGLSIDITENKLYWNDAKRKVIEVSELDGSQRKIIVKDLQHPYGLSLMGDSIFWSDWMTKSIHQANKSANIESNNIVVNNLDGIMDIRAINLQNLDGLEDACGNNNGGCSHLCLRNPHGYSCACPTGVLLKEDQKTCYTSPNKFLVISGQKSLARISLDTLEMRDVDLKIDIQQADSVDFHWERGLIIFSDNFKSDNDIYMRYIKTVDIHDMTKVRTIIAEESDSFYQLAVDWLADNIYLIDPRKNMIEVVKLDGSCRKVVVNDTSNNVAQWFSTIVLYPKYGYMFWCQWGKHVNIQRAHLDGSGRKVIVSSDLLNPNGLSIDFVRNKLYWADLRNNRIEMSDLNGKFRFQLVAEASNPYRLTLLDDSIYWIGQVANNQQLMRADKTTGSNRINIRTTLSIITNIKAVAANLQQGWNPCVVDNGGCSHLCLFAKKNYTCACPDIHVVHCSTVPSKYIPIRKPGTENNPDYDLDDDEKSEVNTKNAIQGDTDDKFKNSRNNKDKTYTTMTIVIGVVTTITIIIFIAIIYLVCQRKPKQEKYMHPGRRNVLTFSNPNYNASGADVAPCNSQEKKFIWKRLKYDSSQERVYEDNGQTSSPEIVSLIPPTATPTSSRAPSITPRENSPSLIHVTHVSS